MTIFTNIKSYSFPNTILMIELCSWSIWKVNYQSVGLHTHSSNTLCKCSHLLRQNSSWYSEVCLWGAVDSEYVYFALWNSYKVQEVQELNYTPLLLKFHTLTWVWVQDTWLSKLKITGTLYSAGWWFMNSKVFDSDVCLFFYHCFLLLLSCATLCKCVFVCLCYQLHKRCILFLPCFLPKMHYFLKNIFYQTISDPINSKLSSQQK